MKKGIKITLICVGGLIVLVLLLGILLPIIFKPRILQYATAEANRRLNATIGIRDLDISLFRGFPNLYIAFEDLAVVNREPFAGDTLLAFKQLAVEVNLKTLLNPSKVEVRQILLDGVRAYGHVDAQGRKNWDIVPPSEATPEPQADTVSKTESAKYGVALRELRVKEADLRFRNDSTGMEARAQNLDFTLRGNLALEKSDISLNLLVEKLFFAMGGITYAPGLRLAFDANVDADLAGKRYVFRDNSLSINDFTLQFAGEVAMPGDSLVTDVTLSTPRTDFKSLLSLVPAIYSKSFADIQTAGSLEFAGHVQGVMRGKELPSADISLKVNDAMFKYPSLPKQADHINIDLTARYDGKTPDASSLSLRRFGVQLAGNPVELEASVTTPISDPAVAAKAKAQLELSTLADVLPLEGKKLNGSLALNLGVKARKSAVMAKRYQECVLDGELKLKDIQADGVLAVPVRVNLLELLFSPQRVELKSLLAEAGRSNVQMAGRVTDFLPYLLADGTVAGSLTLSSKCVDLNELFPQKEEAEKPDESAGDEVNKTDTTAVSLSPLKRISFVFRSSVDELHFQNIEAREVVGNFTLGGSKLALERVGCKMLKGSANVSGLVDFTQPSVNGLNVRAKLENIDIAETAKTFTSIAQMLPTVERMDGRVGVNLSLDAKLTPSFTPIMKTVNAEGDLTSSSISIVNDPLFANVGQLVGNSALEKPTLQQIHVYFTIVDGVLTFKPFSTKIAGIQGTIGGKIMLDQTLDMSMNMVLPQSMVGKASEVFGQLTSKLGVNVPVPSTIPVAITATGSIKSPKVKIELAQGLQAQVKEAVKEKVQEVVQRVKEDVGKRKEEILAKAQEQADKLVAEAKKLADKTREEAQAKADKLLAEAKKNGMLAELAAKAGAAKLVEEGNSVADKIEREARAKADEVMAKAREEADKLQ